MASLTSTSQTNDGGVNITGKTRLGCLLGSPVRHSLSPVMYNDSFRHLGLDYVYLCFETGPEMLPDIYRALCFMDVFGFNLTMPNKTAIIPLLDELSEEAELIGAVNTVKSENGRMKGYNTDGMGYVRSLRKEGIDIAGISMTLAGAGGAATSIAIQCALEGADRLHLVCRRGKSWDKACSLVRLINEKTSCRANLTDTADRAALSRCLNNSALFTNATSAGMGAQIDQMPLPDPAVLPEGIVVSDIIYEPRRTKLLEYARERGLKTMNGLEMLLYQGEAAFEIWTGLKMPVELIRQRYFS